jgi:hypothetical protein
MNASKPHRTTASLNSGAFLLDAAKYSVKSMIYYPEFHKFGRHISVDFGGYPS